MMGVEGDPVVCAMTFRKETASVVTCAVLVTKMVEEVVVEVTTEVEMEAMARTMRATVLEVEVMEGVMAMVVATTAAHVVCVTSSRVVPAVLEIHVNSLMKLVETVVVLLLVELVEEDTVVVVMVEEVELLGYATNGKLEIAVMATLVDLPTISVPNQTLCF